VTGKFFEKINHLLWCWIFEKRLFRSGTNYEFAEAK